MSNASELIDTSAAQPSGAAIGTRSGVAPVTLCNRAAMVSGDRKSPAGTDAVTGAARRARNRAQHQDGEHESRLHQLHSELGRRLLTPCQSAGAEGTS